MRADDFFVDNPDAGPWGVKQRTLNDDLISKIHAGPISDIPDVEVAGALARLVHEEYEERGTHDNPRLTVRQSRGVMAALKAVLTRLGILFTPPFQDFDDFYRYWREQGASGSGGWAKRREMVADILNPVHDELADRQAGLHRNVLAEPVGEESRTGWTRVDEEIAELRRHFQNARTPQDYRNIGNDCVIVLERLSQDAYDVERHLDEGNEEPPVANTKQRLARVIEVELQGSGHSELRKLVRSAIEQAQAVKHRTPSYIQAAIAADTVILLASMFRRITSAGTFQEDS